MKYTSTIFVILAAFSSAYSQWTPSPFCPFPSEELTREPYEGDCSKYWECYEGARYPMDCPEGLQFNAKVSRCDDPSIANCDPDVTIIYPTYPHSTVSTPSTQNPGPRPDCPFPSDELTFYPVKTNCSRYWECFQGVSYLMSCPSGLYWNPKQNYCDYPGNVDCNADNSTTTSPGTTAPTTTTPGTTPSDDEPSTNWTPDPLCPFPSEELTFYPHPTNCSLYYECYEGNKVTMACPEGLLWNELANICDYKENVNCNRTNNETTVAPTTEPGLTTSNDITTTAVPAPSTTPNPICIGQPDGTYLSDPNDCSRFYECVDGKATEGQCPGDLVWNAPIHSCDYRENVVCANITVVL